jgi:5,10-methylenetetrahydromethanopterin reductase
MTEHDAERRTETTHPPIETGVELTPEVPLDRVVELAERAQSAGFEAALVTCHYFNRDPFVAADRIAGGTNLRVGPAAANPYDVHPVPLASRVATLQEATGGRAVMGIAPGDRSTLYDLGVKRPRPLRRTLETIRVARRLWAGGSVDHDGTFRANDAELTYAVDRPSVYVGAQGPDMIRMSAKHADGVLINAAHPRDFSWASERVEEGLSARDDAVGDRDENGDTGGNSDAFDAVAYASLSVAEDGDRAREAARPPVAFIVGGAADPVLDRHDVDRDRAREVSALLEAGDLRAAFDAVTPRMIDAFAVAGTPESTADRLEAILDHVDSVVVGSPLGPDPETAIRLAGRILRRIAR